MIVCNFMKRICMDKSFQWFVTIGVVLFLYVRLSGSNPLLGSLIYSVILLGCYFHLFCVPQRNATKHNQKQ
jgi:hypothetical protein